MSEIRDRILARRDLDAARAARDLDAMAEALNAEGVKAPSAECWVDALGIVNRCPSGKSIIRKLKAGVSADAMIEVAWTSLVSGKGLDFAAVSTQESINEMAAAIGFTEEERNELANLPMQTTLVTRLEVEAALYNPDGTEKE
jgi:hypothetical protein